MKEDTLIPLAYDLDGGFVTVKDAVRGRQYVCPDCGGRLMFRNSGLTGPGHRRPHFAHIDDGEHHCTASSVCESVLHATFKREAAELFRSFIAKKKPFLMEWQCSACGARLRGDMLHKASSVEVEHHLGVCKPDVAILDADGNTMIAFEVVVTHSPEEQTLAYYREHSIVLCRVDLKFDDTESLLADIEGTIRNRAIVTFCPNRLCEVYNPAASSRTVRFIPYKCSQCNRPYKRAEALLDSPFGVFRIPDLDDAELSKASSAHPNEATYVITRKVFGREVHTVRTYCGCTTLRPRRRSAETYYFDNRKGRFVRRRPL